MPDSFRDLRLFVAAFEECSFTAAAAREHATQSGVSQHIRKLEDRLGVQLFLRGAATVVPTPAGETFYRHAIGLLRAQQEALRSARDHAGRLQGEARVGLMPTMTRLCLAPALARFMAAEPNVLVRIREAYSAVLTAAVRAGELDFAIVPGPVMAPGLSVTPFLHTPEVLVSGRASGLPHLAPVALRHLPPPRLVLPGPSNARRHAIETYMISHGIRPERVVELDAMLGTLDMVASQGWMTILPAVMMADGEEGGQRRFTLSPLADPPLGLDLVLIEPARRAIGPEAAVFLAVLREEAARVNARWADAPRPAPPPGQKSY
jgi:DNA-binding transcriptional LysR family regulator